MGDVVLCRKQKLLYLVFVLIVICLFLPPGPAGYHSQAVPRQPK